MKLDLHTNVRWCKRMQFGMGGTLVAVMLVFYMVGYRPQIKQLEAFKSNIQREQNELRDNQNRTRLLPVVAAEVKQLQARVDDSKQLPSQQELPEFLKEVALLAQHASLHGFSVKPGMQSHGDLFDLLPVSLSFDGDYRDVENFLIAAEDMKRLTRIGAISIKNEQGQPGQVQVQLSMNLYFAPE